MGSSKIIPEAGYRWADVPLGSYKEEAEPSFRGVTRQVLLGGGEPASDLEFELRYFEVAAGGFTALERHRHPHAVVVVRGVGEVCLGSKTRPVAALDCVYVAPGEVHQFRAGSDGPLGFLCVVDRDRDRPQEVTPPAP